MSRMSALYEAYLRKVPRQSRSRSVVEAIIEAASERLAHDGDNAVTVQGVADRAGVGIGSLYDYFGDRGSLLAAIAAKITEDNRHAFDRELERTTDLDLEEAIGRIVDFCIARFTSSKRGTRAVLKIAYAIGFMPTLAASTNLGVASLARMMRQRDDVTVADPELAAWTVTHAMMGIAHTLIWQDRGPPPDALRDELITVFSRYLGGERAQQERTVT